MLLTEDEQTLNKPFNLIKMVSEIKLLHFTNISVARKITLKNSNRIKLGVLVIGRFSHQPIGVSEAERKQIFTEIKSETKHILGCQCD